MAFIVQTDSGNAVGANAYLSVAAFKAYHDDRAQSYGSALDAAIEAALIKATDYLDTHFKFVGSRRADQGQLTQWPRVNALTSDGMWISGLPEEVKFATAEYALRALTAALDPDPTTVSTTGAAITFERNRVGPVETSVSYAAGGAPTMPSYPAADAMLRRRGLVISGRNVVRG